MTRLPRRHAAKPGGRDQGGPASGAGDGQQTQARERSGQHTKTLAATQTQAQTRTQAQTGAQAQTQTRAQAHTGQPDGAGQGGGNGVFYGALAEAAGEGLRDPAVGAITRTSAEAPMTLPAPSSASTMK